MSLDFRRAEMADLEALNALARRAVAEIGSRFYTRRQVARAVNGMARIDPELIVEGGLYVARDADDIVGCGAWSRSGVLLSAETTVLCRHRTAGPGSAALRSLFVRPRHTRRGIANSLLRICRDDAQCAGFRRMETLASAAARVPCRRFGFGNERVVCLRFEDGVELASYHMSMDL